MNDLTTTMMPLVPGSDVIERGLQGRRRECEVLDRLVANTRAGQSQVLVLRGAAGSGKTALLKYVWRRASGCRVVKASGRESEMELAFAGLHQICAPLLDRFDRLPGPQREALGAALGLHSGGTPDHFLVGVAVLRLLSEAGRERPLVCLVDDAQRLDRPSAQVLEFVSRRLGTEPVAVVFAVRQCHDDLHMKGFPGLPVKGLVADEARALLESVVSGPLDEQVRDRIVAETGGKPLMLLEMAHRLAPEELAGGFGVPDALAPSALVEEQFRRQLEPLPAPARLVLLVAAAEPVLDAKRVRHAVDLLGVSVEDAAPAAAAGLITLDGQVRFCHPLARFAVYRAAAPDERRSVHRALAEATSPEADPDRRAWHRALGTSGFDEDVAAELERAAGRARVRGGLVAAAAFYERAAMLTPDPDHQAARALTAAHAKRQAGASDAAQRLLVMAQAGPLDELGRVRADKLHAQMASGRNFDHHSVTLLLEAARRLTPLHFGLARETYRDALEAALISGRLARGANLRDVAEVVLGPDGASTSGPTVAAADLLLKGVATISSHGHLAGAPILAQALARFRQAPVLTEESLGWLPLACHACHDVWDDDSLYVLSTGLVRLARQAGAMATLPQALLLGMWSHLLAGEFATAASMAERAEAVARETGSSLGPYGPLVLAAWSGKDSEVSQLVAAASGPMVARGEGQWLTAAQWALALVNNGLRRYDVALLAAEQASEYPDERGLATWARAELIEAAARTGHTEQGTASLARLSEATRASGTDWALGIEARSRALLSEGEGAERLYEEAILRLGRTRIRAELGRAHLVYGEWLRRQNRRVDARQQLRTAQEMLTRMGLAGFADRARRELLATGETVRKRNVETYDELTPQEAQIARLACEGLTNPEIGTQLFISSRTVEWHLRKVFSKLGVNSRRALREALPTAGALDLVS